jgi:hypothetical protein
MVIVMFLAIPNYVSILVTNTVAVSTLLTVGIGSSYKLKDNSKESKTLIAMMIFIGLSAIIDPIVFLVDGNSNIVHEVNGFFIFIIHFGNGAMSLLNLLTVISWSIFLVLHLNGDINKKRIIAYCKIIGIE